MFRFQFIVFIICYANKISNTYWTYLTGNSVIRRVLHP